MNQATFLRYALALALLLTITIVPALVAGNASDRWGEPTDRIAAAAKLAGFPLTFGDWQQTADESIAEGTLRELRCTGYFNRNYVNRRTGETASVILMVGPPGPTVRHPPEICYGNRSETALVTSEQNLTDVAGIEHRVRMFEFSRPTAPGRKYAVAYSWNAGESWQVPTNPRATFGAKPLLYKIQILVDSRQGESSRDEAPAWKRFLQEFAPIFARIAVRPAEE